MTAEELQAIRARIEGASDGPWSVRRIPNSYESEAGDKHTHPCVRGFRVPRRLYNLAWQQCEADAEFMAQARQDVPNLIAEIEHLRSTLRDCHAALDEMINNKSVCPDDLSRVTQFLAEEDAQWEGGQKKLREVRKLYMTPAPMRAKEAGAATPLATKSRKAS